MPNYITVNLRVGYHLTDHATVSVVAEQLNQQSIVETAGVPTERRVIAGLEVKF